MYDKIIALALVALALGGAAPRAASTGPSAATPLERCGERDGFTDPSPPAHIFGNVWYVGTCGVTVLLLTSPSGHILVDSGPTGASDQVLANIRRLGFRPRDIHWIVTSHEHFDHTGGLAAIKKATRARIVARAPALGVLQTGHVDAGDPQFADLTGQPPVTVDRVVEDGETVVLGPLRLTAIATPGHTLGATSWTWRSCTRDTCHRFDYIDSVSALAAAPYRFADHPDRVALFRHTFDRVAALECDVVLTPHPSASAMFERMAGKAPLAEPGGCRTVADAGRRRLDKLLAEEAKTPRS